MFNFENKKHSEDLMEDSLTESSCDDENEHLVKRHNTTDNAPSTQKSTTKKLHNRQKSRDAPVVSDQIKYARSTFVEKNPKKNAQLQEILRAGNEENQRSIKLGTVYSKHT